MLWKMMTMSEEYCYVSFNLWRSTAFRRQPLASATPSRTTHPGHQSKPPAWALGPRVLKWKFGGFLQQRSLQYVSAFCHWVSLYLLKPAGFRYSCLQQFFSNVFSDRGDVFADNNWNFHSYHLHYKFAQPN